MPPLPVPAENALPAHHDPFTPERQAEFLQRLADWGNVRAACKASAISRSTAYRQKRACVEFAELWDGALLLARSKVEEVLADRALNGVEEKVFYHGEEVAVRKRYNPQLLLAHLARLDKLAYRPAARDAADSFDQRLERLASGAEEESYDEMIAHEDEEERASYDGPPHGRPSLDGWQAMDAEMEELARARGSF